MSADTLALTPARRSGGLTPKGLAVAYTYRLRQAVETLPTGLQRELLADLRDLVEAYAPRSSRPIA